jgi:hypothetical protein
MSNVVFRLTCDTMMCLFSDAFAVFLKNFRCDLKAPMQQSLTDYGADRLVVALGVCSKNFVTKLRSKPSFWSCTFEPARDLSGVVGRSSALVEPTVPLEPTIWIRVSNPPTTFPHPQ